MCPRCEVSTSSNASSTAEPESAGHATLKAVRTSSRVRKPRFEPSIASNNARASSRASLAASRASTKRANDSNVAKPVTSKCAISYFVGRWPNTAVMAHFSSSRASTPFEPESNSEKTAANRSVGAMC